jgi:hypothetical protein
VEGREHSQRRPLAKPVVAGGRAAELLGDGIPLTPRPKPIDDAVEHQPVVHRRPPALGVPRANRYQPTHEGPDFIGHAEKLALHAHHKSHPSGALGKFSTSSRGSLLAKCEMFSQPPPNSSLSEKCSPAGAVVEEPVAEFRR